MRWCTWATVAVVAALLALAVQAVVQDVDEGKNLQLRQEIVWAWIALQTTLLAVAFFRKKLLPRARLPLPACCAYCAALWLVNCCSRKLQRARAAAATDADHTRSCFTQAYFMPQLYTCRCV